MLWQLSILGLALGLNNALASIALGTMQIRRSRQLMIALIFGVFEAGMPVLGMWIGKDLSMLIGNKAKFIGIFILAMVGIYSLLKSGDSDEEKPAGTLGVRTLVLAGALSLDNLTVGFALGMMSLPMGLAALVFGVISLTMTLIGLEIGRFIGNRVNVSADKLSGVVLLFTAALMLVH